MNRELAKKVADAVLYEGYMLYPYRLVRDQEPPALDIRHPVSACLRRSSAGNRARCNAFGVSGDGER